MERWKTVGGTELQEALLELCRDIGGNPIAFLCIGTDRSTGDALGPLVGTALAELGYPLVFGTLASPCDAHTLPAKVAELGALAPDGAKVLAIDAALGRRESVGKFQVTSVPTMPGSSLGRSLPPVGDYGIAGIVNAAGTKSYSILQNTSLHRVMRMADEIVASVAKAFPLPLR